MDIRQLPPYPEHDEAGPSQQDRLTDRDAAGRGNLVTLVLVAAFLASLCLIILWWWLSSVSIGFVM